MKQYLILERHSMDDIPVRCVKDREEAIGIVLNMRDAARKNELDSSFATERWGTDASTLTAYSVHEIDESGYPDNTGGIFYAEV